MKLQGFGLSNCYLLRFRSLQEEQVRGGDGAFGLGCLLHTPEAMQSSQLGVQIWGSRESPGSKCKSGRSTYMVSEAMILSKIRKAMSGEEGSEEAEGEALWPSNLKSR